MKRIYFLAPNIEIANKIVDELRLKKFEDRHIHILAKRDTPLEDIPEAGVSIKTDFIPALERGIALGGTTGLLAGVAALSFSGFVIAGGPLLGVLFAGATIGGLSGGLSGMNSSNSRYKRFKEAIEQGELLILLDIPKEKIDEISKLIIKHHPEVEFEGIEPVLPPSY